MKTARSAKIPAQATILISTCLAAFSFAESAVFRCRSGDAQCLVEAIRKANARGQADTIKLEAGTYTLKEAAEINDDGPNGLPSIKTKITIEGQDPTNTVIKADPAAVQQSSPGFRIIHVAEQGNLILDNVSVRGGFLDPGDGAGIFNRGTLSVLSSIIADNMILISSGGGGGIANVSGIVNIADSIIAENTSGDGIGGGIWNVGNGSVTIKNSTIRNNGADIQGGGILNGGDMTIERSTISANIGGRGAGILNAGTLVVSNTTIARNIGFSLGAVAGIANVAGKVSVLNSTIAENVSDTSFLSGGAGGIQNSSDGTVELQNSVLALNTVTTSEFGPFASDCTGTITSLGNNLIGDPTDCDIDLLVTDLTGNPRLGDLVGAGEGDPPGSGFLPVLSGSPLIDAANPDACPKTDQVENPRMGVCDIGAIEFFDGLLVTIEINSRSDRNRIAPKSKGKVTVTILSTDALDATAVDVETIRFGRTGTEASPSSAAIRDFDRDKDSDLILRFEIPDTEIQCGDTAVVLRAETADGLAIFGSTTIRTTGCGRQ